MAYRRVLKRQFSSAAVCASARPHSSARLLLFASAEAERAFYRAMHFSAFARSCDRMSSVRLSVRLSVCNVGDL